MRLERRTQWLWAIVALALAGFFLLNALGYVPAGAIDLVTRAWPALLILAGLGFILRERIPLGSIVALVITALIVGGVAVSAFTSRAGQQRDDYQQTIQQTIDPSITLLRVRVATLSTDVEFTIADDETAVRGEFLGSEDNQIVTDYDLGGDNSATLTLTETTASTVPRLETIGRGSLTLALPPGIPIDIDYAGGAGTALLNLDGLSLERLNVDQASGDVIITLPAYDPALSGAEDNIGALAALDGDLSLFIPAAVAARLELNRGGSGIQPQYDANVFNYLVGDVLESRNIVSSSLSVRFSITVPRGLVRVQAPGA